MNSAANLTISSQPQTMMAISHGASIPLIYTAGLESISTISLPTFNFDTR